MSFFADLHDTDARLGGKARSLARLSAAGLATPSGFAMMHSSAASTCTIWKAPLFVGLLDPEIVIHEPTSSSTRPVKPVTVRKGALSGVPLVFGTHTPPTLCPQSAGTNDPPPAVVMAAAEPEACGASRY